jgi:hypothetical protein
MTLRDHTGGADLDRLYEAAMKRAHDAPMAQIYEDHKGNKFIGVHTDAWWKESREAHRLWELRRARSTLKAEGGEK